MRQPNKVKRSCGSCNACCIVFTVPEVGKHDCKLCHHAVAGRGCRIYKSRPLACQLFTCAWLHGQGDDGYRPDRLGVMIHAEEVALEHRSATILHLWEIIPGALEQSLVSKIIELNLDAGFLVSCHTPSDGVFVSNLRARVSLFSKTEIKEIQLRRI